MSEYSGVLTYGEVRAGELSPVSLELLGIGRTLADARGEELSMVLIDREAESCSRDAVAYGADRVYVIEDAPTDHFEAASFAAIMEKLCTDTVKPAVVLLGQTIDRQRPGPPHRVSVESGSRDRLHRARDRPANPEPGRDQAGFRWQCAGHLHREARRTADRHASGGEPWKPSSGMTAARERS